MESARSPRWIARVLVTCGICATVMCLTSDALAQGYGFVVAGVSYYGADGGGGCNGGVETSTGGVSDVEDFATTLKANGWLEEKHWYDTAVSDTLFYDPQVTGHSYDTDNTSFDPAAGTFGEGVSLSYYAGHGHNTPADYSNYSCTHAATDCPATVSPYWGSPICTTCPTGPYHDGGTTDCLGVTRAGPGVCRYAWDVSARVHGNTNEHCDNINWGQQDGGIAYGESTVSGGWAGAGTNGGTNMVVFHQSFGGTAGLWTSETKSVFAGLHLLGMTSPVSSDTDVGGGMGDLGTRFATTLSNPNSVVGDDFIGAMATVTVGTGCPQTDPNPMYDAGGFNSCGCDAVISWAQDAGWAYYHVKSETWDGLENGLYDATGNGYSYVEYNCNYNWMDYSFDN